MIRWWWRRLQSRKRMKSWRQKFPDWNQTRKYFCVVIALFVIHFSWSCVSPTRFTSVFELANSSSFLSISMDGLWLWGHMWRNNTCCVAVWPHLWNSLRSYIIVLLCLLIFHWCCIHIKLTSTPSKKQLHKSERCEIATPYSATQSIPSQHIIVKTTTKITSRLHKMIIEWITM